MSRKETEIGDSSDTSGLNEMAPQHERDGGLFQSAIGKNQNLPVILGREGGHITMQDLSSENLLERMAPKDIERLFFTTISSGMYDVAMELFEKYPAMLSIARDDQEQLTALHMLVRKPPQEIYIGGRKPVGDKLQLLKEVWSHVTQLKCSKILELISEPSPLLFDAIKSENINAVEWLLYMNPELVAQKDSNGRNLLQFATLHRRQKIFDIILQTRPTNLMMRAIDNDRNNVLHIAAHMSKEESSSIKPHIRLSRELRWFKEVEKRVPSEFSRMSNSKGKTPKDIFLADHEKLLKEAMEEAKEMAMSGMFVATLVAFIMCCAAVTVPDDKTDPLS